MNMRTRNVFWGFIVASLLVTMPVFGQYKAAIRQLSTSDTYVALVNAIAEQAKVTIDIQIVPGARANFLVETGAVNFFAPDILPVLQVNREKIKYDFSKSSIFPMAFVLYTNKNKPVDIADLKAGNSKKAKVEVDLSQANVFEFKGLESTSLEGSLKRVDSGQIDGFIFSQTTGDALVKKLGLKNIKRQLYGNFEMSFGIPKNSAGTGIDLIIQKAMNELRASKKLETIVGQLQKAAVYEDWQP